MKKTIGYILILFIFMFVGTLDVKATKITISGNDKVALNKTIDITFTVSDYDRSGEINIEYPSNLLICNSTCPTNVQITGNTSFTYQFKAIANGNATIKVTSGYQDDVSKSITVGTVTTAPVSTTKKEEQTTKPAATQPPMSNNANLKSLTITDKDGNNIEMSPKFEPNIYEYSVTVGSNVKKVNIDSVIEDSKASMILSNNANEELVAGENNKITITVTAEDGTKRAYTLNIKREVLGSDATLIGLKIKEVKDFKLTRDKFNYVVKIGKNVKKLSLNYELSDESSVVTEEGNENLKDGSKVKLTVTAEDGTKKVYTLEIKKDKDVSKDKIVSVDVEKNPLVIMMLSIVAFGLIGGIIYVIKK